MAAGPVFPGFIKIEYKTDPSAKAKFLAEAAQLGGEVKKPFSEAFDQIGKMVDRVSGKLKDGNFSIDLDVSSLRQAAAQTDFTMKKVQALRDAAISLATKNRDTSESTKAFVTALQAQAAQSEAAARAARDQVTAYSNLQSAVSGLTRENEALAQSYRDTFLEQAKVANAAYKAQQQFNALSAPGLGRTAKSARDSASVFESQSYAPKADLRSGLQRLVDGDASLDKAAASGTRLEDVLRRVSVKGKEVTAALREAAIAAEKAAAEQGKALNGPKPANAAPQSTRFGADALVAGQASLDRAAISATTLEQVLGRVANKGREVGAALAEAERAAAKAEAEAADAKAKAAAELQRLGQAAEALNARLNPAVAVQQRFNNEIEQARKLLAAGVIDQRLYGQAVEQANRDQSVSLKLLAAAQDQASSAAKRGTSETQNVINSTRSLRVAGIQAGQQIQDMAVQFQMGTKASTILAQQLPQLAFALSGLEGNTNKTLSRVGAFSTFLAGPWGAAILIAGVALGPFIDELYRTLTAADDATEALQKFINKQREVAAGALEETQAMIGLNKARSELLEIDLKLAKRPKGPDGTPLFSYKDLERRKELTWQIVEAEGALNAAEAKPEAAAKNRTATTRTARSASPKGGSVASLVTGEFGEDAAKRILNIRDSFADIPPEVERINRASRELDDIISDLMNRKPKGFESLKAEAEALKASLADGVITQALAGMEESSQRQLQVQELLLSGREAEAAALQNLWQIEQRIGSEAELRTKAQALILQGRNEEAAVLTRIANQYPRIRSEVQDIAEAEQRRIEAMRKMQEIQAVFLDATRSVRGEVEAILGGYGSLGDLGKTLRRSFQNIQGKILTEQIFGDVFRDMDRYVKEKTGIGSSVDMLKTETERAGAAASDFADTLINATRTIQSGGAAAGSSAGYGSGWSSIGIPALLKAPANENYDPNAEIMVNGQTSKDTKRDITDLTPEEFFNRMGQKVGAAWAKQLEPLLGKKLAGNLGGVLGGVLEGQATTGTGFGAILGGLKELKGSPKGLSEGLGKAFKGAQTGAAVAGISNALGLKKSNGGAQAGGALGSLIGGPVGGILGSVAGGLLGKLFGSTKSGYAQVRNGEVAGTFGRTGKLQAQAAELAGSLVDQIGGIAQALGTRLGGFEFDIGKKNSNFVVNTGARGTFNFKTEAEAIAFAIRDAVYDGAFIGLSEGAKRLILNGGNLEKQIAKAAQFQNVFKELRAIKDPVGAALDDLNGQFKDLIGVFKEAGASSQEFAQLEELYGLKRADAIKQATEAMTSSLKGLLDEINIGSDFFSLRDRKASALEAYNPLKARVAAGDTTAFEAFSEAARNLISIEREISGSTSPFFALLQEVTTLSQNALTGQNASISAASASDSPFAALAAQNAATASAIDNQTDALIAAIGGRLDLVNANLIAALRNQSVQTASMNVPSLAVGGYW